MKREKFDKRTREYFELAGWIVEQVEHFNPYAGRTKDFGGFADQIAYLPYLPTYGMFGDIASKRERKTVAIQTCRAADWTTRRKKIISNGRALAWILAGNEIWIAAWKVSWEVRPNKIGVPQKQKSYDLKLHILGVEDFKDAIEFNLPQSTANGGLESPDQFRTNSILLKARRGDPE